MTVDGHEVTKAEFEYIYHKNNTNNAVDKKTLDEYIELFKNFKLKVAELKIVDWTPYLHLSTSYVATAISWQNLI